MSENAEEILEEIRKEFREKDFQITVGISNQGNGRFFIEPVLEQILKDDRDKFFNELIVCYRAGRELYEKTLKDKNFSNKDLLSEEHQKYVEQSRQSFLSLFKSPHVTGVSYARDCVCHKIIKKFLDEMVVSVTFLEDDKEYNTLGTSTKFAREQEKKEETERAEMQKIVEYWKGYDKRASEYRNEENLAYNQKNKSLIMRIIERFFGNK